MAITPLPRLSISVPQALPQKHGSWKYYHVPPGRYPSSITLSQLLWYRGVIAILLFINPRLRFNIHGTYTGHNNTESIPALMKVESWSDSGAYREPREATVWCHLLAGQKSGRHSSWPVSHCPTASPLSPNLTTPFFSSPRSSKGLCKSQTRNSAPGSWIWRR